MALPNGKRKKYGACGAEWKRMAGAGMSGRGDYHLWPSSDDGIGPVHPSDGKRMRQKAGDSVSEGPGKGISAGEKPLPVLYEHHLQQQSAFSFGCGGRNQAAASASCRLDILTVESEKETESVLRLFEDAYRNGKKVKENIPWFYTRPL